MNDAALFQAIERLTGCESIGSFFGSVYRIVAGKGHFHTWPLTEVEPGPDKTAFAGWFVRSPGRAAWLRGDD